MDPLEDVVAPTKMETFVEAHAVAEPEQAHAVAGAHAVATTARAASYVDPDAHAVPLCCRVST